MRRHIGLEIVVVGKQVDALAFLAEQIVADAVESADQAGVRREVGTAAVFQGCERGLMRPSLSAAWRCWAAVLPPIW
jgi:hypothetical protein